MKGKEFLKEFTYYVILTEAKRQAKELQEEILPKLQKKIPVPKLRPSIITRAYPTRPAARSAARPAAALPAAPAAPAIAQAIDLGKINPFVADHSITEIECNAGKAVTIKKEGKEEETTLTLNEREVRGMIEKFSQATKIPLDSMFKALYENLTINAIISDIIGSRLLITKIQ